MKSFFERLLYAPASRRSLVAARVIMGAYSLWLVLSRPTLWAVTEWPRAIFPLDHPTFLLRFGLLLLPARVEHVLYLLLLPLLVAVMAGWRIRVTALASSLLLYHFAPMEEVVIGLIANGNAGFTLPVLGLVVLAFARYDDGPESPEYRWPVVTLQSLLALQYIFGGLLKVRYTGIGWYTGHNVSKTVAEMVTLTGAPWGDVVASSPTLSWLLMIATLLLELLFPLAVVSRRARWILIPAAAVAAFLRPRIYGFYTLTAPLLLLFVNWDWVARAITSRRAPTRDVLPSSS